MSTFPPLGGVGGPGSGEPGPAGASAYQLAVLNGFVGTLSQWLASLKGEPGDAGADGTPGSNGGLNSLHAFMYTSNPAVDAWTVHTLSIAGLSRFKVRAIGAGGGGDNSSGSDRIGGGGAYVEALFDNLLASGAGGWTGLEIRVGRGGVNANGGTACIVLLTKEATTSQQIVIANGGATTQGSSLATPTLNGGDGTFSSPNGVLTVQGFVQAGCDGWRGGLAGGAAGGTYGCGSLGPSARGGHGLVVIEY